MKTTLPARYYTEPETFRLEIERLFSSMWICAGRLDEVRARGAFVRRDVGNASVLIVGDGQGGARAFHNVCRHRGTRLCDASSGRFSSIQCPYHAWTYDLDGRLIGAPQMNDVPGFTREAYPLRQASSDVWDGHVFLNLGASPSPLLAQLGDLPQRFAPWGMDALRMVRRVEYDVAANWKLVVQNYNECLHCPVIHPMLNRMHHYLGASNVPSTGSYCGGSMGFNDGIETLSVDGRRRRDVLPGLGPAERSSVSYFAIYPNLLLTLHPDYMVTVTIWPQSPERTRLVCEWHFHPDEIGKSGFVHEDAVAFWDATNREDWAISERSQQGIASRGYAPGPYSAREQQLWEFDEFVLRALHQEPNGHARAR
jgi:Rieske 2Fe-2S family protein